MKFKARFMACAFRCSEDGQGFVYDRGMPAVESQEIGVLIIDKLLASGEEFEIDDLPTCTEAVSSDGLEPVILTFNEARESGHFEHQNQIVVDVEHTLLREYLSMHVVEREFYDDEDNHCKVEVIFLLNCEMIKRDWKAAGYPKQWRGESE